MAEQPICVNCKLPIAYVQIYHGDRRGTIHRDAMMCINALQADRMAAQTRADRFHRALLRIAVLEVQRDPDEGDTVYQIATKALEEDLDRVKKEAQTK